jgi:F-type H+-transporting ATPase subunit alpha
MKQVANRLRLDMANFRELAAFAQFGSELDRATQQQLNRGQHLQEILKQPQYAPMSLENQVMEIFAGTQGYTDKIPLERMQEWETAFLRFMETSYPEIGKDIAEKKRITDENMAALRAACDAFNQTWTA